MLQKNRKEKIIKLLVENKEFKISDLCKHFNISLATIHRDLNELEREGRVKKVHGRVYINEKKDFLTENEIRLKINLKLKEKIAKKALDFVNNKECLFIDNSSTCYYFAKELAESKFRDIVIVTNSYKIPELFITNNNIKVVSTGGILLKDFDCFSGWHAVNTINEFNGNKFFFSTAGISIEGELSDVLRPDSDEI